MRTGFTFRHAPPRRPASYGDDSAFTITPSCPAASAASRNAAGNLGIVGADRRDDALAGDGRQRVDAHVERLIEQVAVVEAQTVEEERAQRDALRVELLAPEAAHRVLEAVGAFVLTDADGFAVEDQGVRGEVAHRGDDLGEPFGDVVEVPGVHAHLVARAVHLDARAVELPFDRGEAGRGERLRHVFRGRREHRQDRSQHVERDLRERVGTTGEREVRGDAQVAAQHGGALHDGTRDIRRSGRSRRSSLLRARPAAARRGAAGGGSRPRRVSRGRTARSRRSRRARTEPGPVASRTASIVFETSRDGQDRLAVVPGVEVAQRRPTDTDAALRRVADEVAGGRDDLVGRDACKQRRERVDLREPRNASRKPWSRSRRRRRAAWIQFAASRRRRYAGCPGASPSTRWNPS